MLATESKLVSASPLLRRISSTTCAAGPLSWPVPVGSTPGSFTTTRAPSSARYRATTRPIPRPAPVTVAALPSRALDLRKDSPLIEDVDDAGEPG